MKPIFALIAGVASLMIVMGIGRFAYTPILPFMQHDTHFSETMSGLLASSNYLGYLLGALVASFYRWRKGKAYYLKIYLVVNIVTTLLMGLTAKEVFWLILRLFSGLSSGLVFVLASGIILETLEIHKRQYWSGIFYGGVGLGIFLSGLVVPVFTHYLSWEWAWIGLSLISIVISIVSFLWTRENSCDNQLIHFKDPVEDHKTKKNPFFKWLLLAYGCEGIGYIITGTFLVAIVRDIPQLKDYASMSWAFVGLAAIPSCFIWAIIAKKYGHIKTLYCAYAIQIIGIILPVFTHSVVGVFLGSLLFGGTFMGITTLTVSVGKNLSFQNTNKAIGYLTASYGLGQVIGPMIAGILTSHSNNYNGALIFASGILLLGITFLVIGHIGSKPEIKQRI